MHQADAVRINPGVAAIPMSQREAIWKAMEGRNDLANLASGNPDNPLGVVWSPQVLKSLAEFTQTHDLLVLVDEIYRETTNGYIRESHAG